jgi:hypothetical protein
MVCAIVGSVIIAERILQVVKAVLTSIAVKNQQYRAPPYRRMLNHSPDTLGLCNYFGSQQVTLNEPLFFNNGN